ncbi:hypothetical protein BMI79_00405 [Serratia oryzae]|uniref:Uncharacterized protein n=1 Tax=Serratia oryzae TaxID=2034155 RepID=A0A1S8CNJ0_9GAMM|nr:hypothetical protein BMI79_00405 [Serratia oryzae]
MTKASFIRVWFTFATTYTCLTLSHQIGDDYFNGAKWPWLIGTVLLTTIVWTTSSKLKELK